MARAEIDEEMLQRAIERATAGLETEIQSLREQVEVLALEDSYLHDGRAAAYPMITRLPVNGSGRSPGAWWAPTGWGPAVAVPGSP